MSDLHMLNTKKLGNILIFINLQVKVFAFSPRTRFDYLVTTARQRDTPLPSCIGWTVFIN